MERVAAVDCGTNSVRLLVAEPSPTGDGLHEVVRQGAITRLGEGVDTTHRFGAAALQRTLDVISSYARICDREGARRIRFAATSAARDAEDRDELARGVRRLLGTELEVLAGEQEASLSFAGAMAGRQSAETGPMTAVVDVGGGSTEIAVGIRRPMAACSMNIGSVRLTERWMRSDPVSSEQISRAIDDVDTALRKALSTVPVGDIHRVIGVSGTVDTVTARVMGLERLDRERLDGARLPVGRVLHACDELVRMPRAEITDLPYMISGRVDVTAAGALIWACVLKRLVAEAAKSGTEIDVVETSVHDILDGLAASLLAS